MTEERFIKLFKTMYGQYEVISCTKHLRHFFTEDWNSWEDVYFLELKSKNGEPPELGIDTKIEGYLGVECVIDFL